MKPKYKITTSSLPLGKIAVQLPSLGNKVVRRYSKKDISSSSWDYLAWYDGWQVGPFGTFSLSIVGYCKETHFFDNKK